MSYETQKRQRLESLLEAYGAEPARWPREDRKLLSLIKGDDALQSLYDEARALDNVLELGAVAPEERGRDSGALQQNILSDFSNLASSRDGKVVELSQHLNRGAKRIAGQGNSSARGTASLQTALALAACFAFGIYLGGIGIGDWTLDPASSFQSLSGEGEQLADITDYVMSGGLEEDLL